MHSLVNKTQHSIQFSFLCIVSHSLSLYPSVVRATINLEFLNLSNVKYAMSVPLLVAITLKRPNYIIWAHAMSSFFKDKKL